jgi:Carboxypeptidase regulatory-like domain
MRNHRFAAVALGLFLFSMFASARTTQGVLDGVVLNGKGAPVAFAEVLWQGADGKAPHAIRTSRTGYFRIAGVPQGLYDVRAEGLGMVSDWEHNVFVPTGKVATVTLRLTHRIPPAGTRGSNKGATIGSKP